MKDKKNVKISDFLKRNKIVFVVLAVIIILPIIIMLIKANHKSIPKNVDDIPLLLINTANIYYEEYPNEENNDLNDPKNAETINTIKQLMDNALEVVDTVNPFCGKNPNYTVTTENDGMVYYLSTEFKSYKELKNAFYEYVYPGIMDLNPDNYIERGGKLYCLKHTDKEQKKYRGIEYKYAIIEDDHVFLDMLLKYDKDDLGYLIEYVKKDGKWLVRFYGIG